MSHFKSIQGRVTDYDIDNMLVESSECESGDEINGSHSISPTTSLHIFRDKRRKRGKNSRDY